MKFLVTILIGAMLLVSSKINAQKQTITATVANVTSDKGTVMFALYDKTNFRMKPLQSEIGKIEGGKTTVVFNVAPGEYAIVCYHDSNGNKKMDFQTNGMPLEDFGASNNFMAFAPPTYENAKFVVANKNVTLDIRF